VQKEDDKPGKLQNFGFCYFLQLFGICTLIVIPFYLFYDSVFFSEWIIWYIELLGDN